LEACGDDAVARAPIIAEIAEEAATAAVRRIGPWAAAVRDEALPAIDGAPDEIQWRVLTAVAWTQILVGNPIDELVERSHRAPGHTPLNLHRSLDRLVAIRHMWRGAAPEARELLWRLLAKADERAE